MSQVICNNIVKRYDETVVLDGVNLNVAAGEFLVILGPSGCGKSTLLRIIAGIETAEGGSISIDGTVVDKVPPRERNVAMVFQNYALYPLMTVHENLAFSLKIRKIPDKEIKSRVYEVAQTLGLENLLNRRPGQLSGGQRQRVAMGRAMVRNPRVFLFDEPLSNLDARLRAKMRGEIKSLHAALDTTTIYVTHDQIEAMTMGSRIAVMRNSNIEQVGTPDEIYSTPINVHVATFIGVPEINILKGCCDGEFFIVDGVKFPLPAGSPKSGDILYCVRPHDLELSAAGRDGALPATIDLVEPTGVFLIVHATVGEQKIVMQILQDDMNVPAPGSACFFRVKPDKVHLFDVQTEKRVGSNNTPKEKSP